MALVFSHARGVDAPPAVAGAVATPGVGGVVGVVSGVVTGVGVGVVIGVVTDVVMGVVIGVVIGVVTGVVLGAVTVAGTALAVEAGSLPPPPQALSVAATNQTYSAVREWQANGCKRLQPSHVATF